MKQIPLNSAVKRTNKYSHLFALVDDEDYDYLMQWKWRIYKMKNTFYARTGDYLRMHVLLLGKKLGFEIDHKDGNGLNNQRSNLRYATSSQNKQNRPKFKKNSTSNYKGIHFSSRKSKWIAKIMKNRKTIHIGTYISEIEAAKAYDEAAKIHHGEFANLNFPEGLSELEPGTTVILKKI